MDATETRLDALKELAAKVESGTADQYNGPPWRELFGGHIQAGNVANAYYNGSIDAAKALHEAVLPGWTLDQFGQRAGGWIAVLGCRDGKTPQPAPQAMVRDNPARAWLLVIIKALIAQETGQ